MARTTKQQTAIDQVNAGADRHDREATERRAEEREARADAATADAAITARRAAERAKTEAQHVHEAARQAADDALEG